MLERGSSRRIGLIVTGWIVLLTLGGSIPGEALTTDELLDELQERAFLYFWNEANPANGLVRDRSTSWSPGKMAATGFGMSAICIGIDRGWVSREAGRDRILTALQTLWTGPQGPAPAGNIGYKGFFYHFVDFNTAVRTWDSDLAPIDTALLFAGIIDAKQYFSTDDSLDIEVRCLADSITHRADWTFMYNGLGISLTWTPETGFDGLPTWVGYNEAMIMYILALGSPTHPIPAGAWFTWTSGYDWRTHYGQTYVEFPPLFGHQYSHCWIDFRNIRDLFMQSKGIDYFENSRRATLAAQAYCIDNPGGFTDYGTNVWGLTAGDGPFGYIARGAPPNQNDDGTITPTAAASSIPFAPEIVIPTLHHFYDTYPLLWSIYGFLDGFNPTLGWYATDYIGIDQGPIIVMIENYRTGAVWERFMQDEDVQRGLERATFVSVVGVQDDIGVGPSRLELSQNAPNPFRGTSTITYRLSEPGEVSLVLFDVLGRPVRTLWEGAQPAGVYEVGLNGEGLSSGVFYYRLEADGESVKRRCMVIK